MNRTLLNTISAFILCLLPLSMVIGQGEKSEKKIKIVVIDDSGKKVVIDTLIKDNGNIDSVILKDGKETSKMVKEVRVVCCDSMKMKKEIKDNNYCCDHSKFDNERNYEHHRMMRYSDRDENMRGEKVIVIRDGDKSDKAKAEADNYRSRTGKSESNTEKTKYVISRDGLMISVEGDDYSKVKELVKVIENKLDADHNSTSKSGVVKEDPKNPVKKK
jgi:ABC-type Na+ efflux pump permease subunit